MNPAALQESVYDVLVGDATLLATLSTAWGLDAVFSDVPQVNSEDDTYYPFISFGPDTTIPFDSKTFSGGRSTIQLNVWTRANDYIQAKQISERIYTLLHKQSLTIAGETHVTTGLESVEYTLDPDGHTRRALMLFEIVYH